MLEFMKILYDCGLATDEVIEKLGINVSIVEDLIRKEQVIVRRVDNTSVYFLTDFGEKVYRLNTHNIFFFRCGNIKKMEALLRFYSELSKEERDSWKSKDVWYSEGFVGAIPDATYIKDGKIYGVYVTTESTTKSIIANVEKFAKDRSLENMSYIS